MKRAIGPVALSLILTLSVTACGVLSATTVIPVAAHHSSHSVSAATFAISVPQRLAIGSDVRRANPRYISTATTSLTITLNLVNGSPPGGGVTTTTLALTRTSPGCATVAMVLQCTVQTSAQVGTDNFTFDLVDGSANVLSTNSVNIVVANGAVNTASVTMNGVATSLQITSSDDHVSGSQAAGFAILGASPQTFTVTPFDHSGAQIVGPGTPTITLTSSFPAKLDVAAAGPANTYNLQVKAYRSSAITITANGGGASASATVATTEELWAADCQDSVTVRAYKLVAGGPVEIAADEIANKTAGGQVKCAQGVGVDPDGNLWVTDFNLGQAVAYTPGNATPIHTLSGFSKPSGMDWDGSGNLWIGDSGNNRVLVFAKSTYAAITADTINFSQLTGSFTTNPIGFDSSGKLWIGRSYDPIAIRAYTPGNSTAISGDDISADNPGRSTADQETYGLAFDTSNHVWFTDYAQSVVKEYTLGSNTQVTSITGASISLPTGIAISGNGTIWVASFHSTGNSEITGYASGGGHAQINADTISGLTDLDFLAISP